MRFDWDDPTTYADALEGVDRVYLVPPVMRVQYANQVAAFLNQAEAAGVRHVTLLSTYNGDRAPGEVDIATVETLVASRNAFTHSILHPAWVMQNFTDDHLPVINGTLTVPSGGGSEAFVDAADIAAVAAETLLDRDAHAPTGDVEAILGRPPTSFQAFAERNTAAWTTGEDR